MEYPEGEILTLTVTRHESPEIYTPDKFTVQLDVAEEYAHMGGRFTVNHLGGSECDSIVHALANIVYLLAGAKHHSE